MAAKRVRRSIRNASHPKCSTSSAAPSGEYNIAGHYQQAPSPQGGGMIKMVWFKSYGANERPEKSTVSCRAERAGLDLHQDWRPASRAAAARHTKLESIRPVSQD